MSNLMTDTTDIEALREASLRDMFENGAAGQEQCSLGFIMSLRNEAGGYSNEKIDDMWLGFKLAVAPEGGRTIGEVALESNRLFDKNKLLTEQLEAERQRADNADSRLHEVSVHCANVESELAKLKGDAVPVAWTDEEELRDMEKYGHAYLFKAGLTPHEDPRRMIKLFTHAQPVPDGWIKCSEKMPDHKSERRVCVYTPTPHEDMRYRFVPASLFKAVCSSATHWYYMEPPAPEDE